MKDQRRLIEDWATYWSAHDTERLLTLFTADVLYEDVPMGATSHGIAELRTFANEVFSRFPTIGFDLQSSVSDGANRGAAEWVMRGTRDLPGPRAARTPVAVRGVSVFEFADGKIRRCSDYWDMVSYLNQLGSTSTHAHQSKPRYRRG
jgi:steroid delta-isomerase-like uncharacterized protein